MPSPDHPIDITQTGHGVLPWRLRVFVPGAKPMSVWDEPNPEGCWRFIPHASCRTKREAETLRLLLEAAADWTVPIDDWPDPQCDSMGSTRTAVVLDILAQTESAQIERAAWEALQT